jgi:deaminated glutathione amidase
MKNGTLRIAMCQFAVSESIAQNARAIRQFMQKAGKAQAEVVHFSECALSGYAGADFPSFDGYDWALLKSETERIMELAGKLGLWVILGSTHPLTPPHPPHNSLYLIGPHGKIATRYDKRFCTSGDLDSYTPGDCFATFELNGIRCSLLICFDLRFPELYRELYRQGVQCVFQSFYNARQLGPSIHTQIMRQTMQCHAATNRLWVSMTNSSGYYSPYPSCFIQPDGVIAGQLRPNRAGLMVNTVDLSRDFYDPMAGFREMALAGKLTNGSGPIDDPRSKNLSIL